MKTLALIITTTLTLCLTTSVIAGVEPSPFQPEINQLGAVNNILSSAEFRTVKAMEHPPEPGVPPEPSNESINGDVNKLEAIAKQVMSLDDMIISMIEEVMGVEPSPFREDLIVPLQDVQNSAQGLANIVTEFVRPPYDNIPVEFMTALTGVGYAAQMVANTAEESIELLNSTIVECTPDYNTMDMDSCSNYENCDWIRETDIAGVVTEYCCCIVE